MEPYITGGTIRRLREEKGLTQSALADLLGVSDKAVSKWETGRGYPDITLIEPIAAALSVSVGELFTGERVTNVNRAANMKRTRFYVCPVCGNVILSAGDAAVSCCGISLPPLTAEEPDAAHTPTVETVEDEYYVTVAHEMSKTHYLSFLAAVTDGSAHLVKLYPEGEAAARFKRGRIDALYLYCDRHGLFRVKM